MLLFQTFLKKTAHSLLLQFTKKKSNLRLKFSYFAKLSVVMKQNQDPISKKLIINRSFLLIKIQQFQIDFQRQRKNMSFIYFPQNQLPTLSPYAFLQNYQPQMGSFMIGCQQQYLQFLQWSSFFPTENVSVQEKQPSTTRLTSDDESSQSQGSVVSELREVQPTSYKPEKRRQSTRTKAQQNISAKKNSESNIINQFYSYMSSQQRSQSLIRRAIHKTIPDTKFEQKILDLFYYTIKLINLKRGRKYVNRNMMLNYFTPEDLLEKLPEIQSELKNCGCISIEELCQIFRRACQAFISQVSLPAIMTSKRITGNSKQVHLKKRRIILKSLMGF